MSETPSNDELKDEINAAMAEAAAQQEPSSEETTAEVIELDLDEAEATSPAGELEEMIATKEQEKAELTAQLQRLAADFENYKKRARRESEDARQFANEKLLRDLLPLVDNLARALEHADAQDPIVQGIQMVSNQFSDILGQYGVERVPGVGAAFNPAHHEAMGRVPTADAAPDSIVQEYEAGYTLHGRLLRPSKVVIAMEAPATESEPEASAETSN